MPSTWTKRAAWHWAWGRLFTEFAQGAKPRGLEVPRGSGLGLAISRALVQAMDGRIGMLDRPGGGSVFWFELSVRAAPHADGTGLQPPR